MSEQFVLRGDPAAIRGSASTWLAFSNNAGTAADDIRGVDTESFQGDESDTYRGRINADMVPHLHTTALAWSIVSTALTAYASTLEGLQQRMSALATKAANQQDAVEAAHRSLASATTADRQHAADVRDAATALKPGQTLPPSTFVSGVPAASSSVQQASAALQGTIDAADDVRGEHDRAVHRCGAEIDRATHLRFVKPPGFWGHLKDSACSWVTDHSGTLLQVSSVLKTVSAVAGVLALVPVLTPIMAPVMLATGAAALAIDLSVKCVTGQGSWLQIGVDTLGLIPGVKSLTTLGKAGGVLSELGEMKTMWKVVDLTSSAGTTGLKVAQAATGEGSWTDAAVSTVGLKIPGSGDKFKAIQSVVASGADMVNKGGTMAYKYATGKEVTGQDWVNLGVSVTRTGVNSGKLYAYRGPGTNPDGSERKAFKAPEYKWGDTKDSAKNAYSSVKTAVTDKVGTMKTIASGAAAGAKNTVTSAAGQAKDALQNKVSEVRHVAVDTAAQVKQSTSNGASSIKRAASDGYAGARSTAVDTALSVAVWVDQHLPR